jgi:hypothetical protein
MPSARFTIDVVGFDAQTTSDLMVGQFPRFTALMARETPEIASVAAGPTWELGEQLCRTVAYELDPMVWAPIQRILEVGAPGLIRYTDLVTFRRDAPGWQFVSEWAGVPGISPSSVAIHGAAIVEDDGPFGCRVHYEAHVECTIPIVHRLVAEAVLDGFRRTCQRMPAVLQAYFVARD